MRDDEISAETYRDLEACTGEHHPLVFSIEAHFDPPDVQIPQRPGRPPPTPEPSPASTRAAVLAEGQHLEAAFLADRRGDVPDVPLPAPPLLVICVLDLLRQVRRGQTQTDLVQGYSRKYFLFFISLQIKVDDWGCGRSAICDRGLLACRWLLLDYSSACSMLCA